MKAGIQVVQVSDPCLQHLFEAGNVAVGESWGARLRLSNPPDLTVLNAAVVAASDQGFPIEELTGGARINAGSIRMNEHLGYAVEERWLSLAMPRE